MSSFCVFLILHTTCAAQPWAERFPSARFQCQARKRNLKLRNIKKKRARALFELECERKIRRDAESDSENRVLLDKLIVGWHFYFFFFFTSRTHNSVSPIQFLELKTLSFWKHQEKLPHSRAHTHTHAMAMDIWQRRNYFLISSTGLLLLRFFVVLIIVLASSLARLSHLTMRFVVVVFLCAVDLWPMACEVGPAERAWAWAVRALEWSTFTTHRTRNKNLRQQRELLRWELDAEIKAWRTLKTFNDFQ